MRIAGPGPGCLSPSGSVTHLKHTRILSWRRRALLIRALIQAGNTSTRGRPWGPGTTPMPMLILQVPPGRCEPLMLVQQRAKSEGLSDPDHEEGRGAVPRDGCEALVWPSQHQPGLSGCSLAK